ncbi:Acyl-CoA reductase [Actinokineospora globicatena]|nr:Acyl-CoA reductase [Actinokineospora globicatena]GLW79308.1 putative aldehyde dehydrogenase [Actinokineospora globicatena]
MRPVTTYDSYVAGTAVPSDRYVHTVSTSAVLADVFSALTLKRRLDQGAVDPTEATDVVVGRVAGADEATVHAATAAAAAAAPIWAATPLSTRLALAAGIRARLEDRHEEFVDVLIAEGTPRALAEWQVAGLFDAFGEITVNFCASQLEHTTQLGPRTLTLRRVPDGVVAVNPPQNAPAASALFGVTALLSGNAVIVRAPRSAPLGVMYALRELVVPVLDELGAPPGTLNVLCARPSPVIKHWLASPDVDTIFYTGSVETGFQLEQDAARHGTKVILELAGNDCVVVWRDADLALATEALAECFFGSGQICMVPNQVLVHPDVADELFDRLRVAAAEIRPGAPEDEGVLLSPVLRGERFFTFVRDALAKGATVVHGARRLETDGTPSDTGLFLEPTVLRIDGLDRADEIDAVRHETFFPLLPVVVCEPGTDAEVLAAMLAHVTANPYGLRNSLWARDPDVIERFLTSVTRCGLLKVNDSHIGFLPFLPTHGGPGRTGGAFGEANYPMLRTTRLQGVSVAVGVHPRAAVFDAYTRFRTGRQTHAVHGG